MIRVLYFASLRERVGVDVENIAEHLNSVGELLDALRKRGGVWSEALADGEAVLVSRNQEMANRETRLADGDEVGIFPPVTGG